LDVRLIVVEQKTSTSEALEEMQSLLRATCSAGSPNRISAVRYTLCRTMLMDGELRPALPGFLIQCVSIYKFHDFISLYDPKAETRIAFVENAFAASRALLESKRIYDVFSDPDF
jgi:hypothetical protein